MNTPQHCIYRGFAGVGGPIPPDNVSSQVRRRMEKHERTAASRLAIHRLLSLYCWPGYQPTLRHVVRACWARPHTGSITVPMALHLRARSASSDGAMDHLLQHGPRALLRLILENPRIPVPSSKLSRDDSPALTPF